MAAEITVVRVTTNTTNVALVEQITVVQAAPATVNISGGSAAVATDTIWDAAGDLAVGTGANTAAVLTKGSSGTWLKAGASSLSWASIASGDVSGLGGAATLNVGTTTGTVAAGDDSRITGAAQKASNLSDLASASTARTNLGLGGAAVLSVGTTAGTVAAGDDSRFSEALDDLTDVTITAAASGDLLRFNGSAWVDYPDSNFAAASHNHAASAITSGTIDTARLGSGTANSGTYLRGDQTWAAVSGGSADPQSGALFFGIQAYGGF